MNPADLLKSMGPDQEDYYPVYAAFWGPIAIPKQEITEIRVAFGYTPNITFNDVSEMLRAIS